MGRIGAKGCAKMGIFGTNQNVPAYEKRGYVGDQQLDDTNRIRLPTNDGPLEWKGFHYGGEQEETEQDIDERLKQRNNKNDFEAKTGRRQEGLLYLNALDQPVININEPYSVGGNSLPLGQFNEEQQKYIRSDEGKPLPLRDTNLDKGVQSLQKTETPYNRDIQPSVMQFIEDDGGRYYKSILNQHSVDNLGSNVIAEEFYKNNGGANQPVGDRSFESLYYQQDGSKTVSNDNVRQQNNFKAKQTLGVFQGQPTMGGQSANPNRMRDMLDEELRSRHIGYRKNRRNSESDEYEKAEQEYKRAEERVKELRAKRQQP